MRGDQRAGSEGLLQRPAALEAQFLGPPADKPAGRRVRSRRSRRSPTGGSRWKTAPHDNASPAPSAPSVGSTACSPSLPASPVPTTCARWSAASTPLVTTVCPTAASSNSTCRPCRRRPAASIRWRFITGGGRPLLLREAVAAIHRGRRRPAGGRADCAGADSGRRRPGPVQELREAIAAFTAGQAVAGVGRDLPRHAVVLPGVGVRRGVDAAVGHRRAGRLRHQRAVPARRARQGRHRGAVRRARRIQVGGKPVHPGPATPTPTGRPTPGWWRACTARCGRPSPSRAGSSVATVDALADRAPLLRDDAVTGGLVDRIGFRDEAYARIAELVGAEGISPETGDADRRRRPAAAVPVPLRPRRRHGPPCRRRPSRAARRKPTIAVVTLAGPIVSGRGGRQCSPFGHSSAGGDTIAAALREAAADDDVAAIVLRVDSPGGSVTGSETIWREVVAGPRGGQAGGGVDGCGGGLRRLLRVDGRRRDRRQPGHHHRLDRGGDRQAGGPRSQGTARASAPTRCAPTPTPTPGRSTHRSPPSSMRRSRPRPTCSTPTSSQRVAEGRDLTVEAVDAVARGRVWTGADALDRGLVDELGGLRTAVRRAKVLAGIDADAEVKIASYPGFVAAGHAAAQAVVAARGGVAAGGRRRRCSASRSSGCSIRRSAR